MITACCADSVVKLDTLRFMFIYKVVRHLFSLHQYRIVLRFISLPLIMKILC